MEVWRADFLFTFPYENEIDWEFAACAPNSVKGGEERSFGTFLIYGAAADDYFAEAGLVDERGVPRRRGPFGGIDLLYVVHEIKAERFGSAGIESGEDAGLAFGGDLVTWLKTASRRICMVCLQPS